MLWVRSLGVKRYLSVTLLKEKREIRNARRKLLNEILSGKMTVVYHINNLFTATAILRLLFLREKPLYIAQHPGRTLLVDSVEQPVWAFRRTFNSHCPVKSIGKALFVLAL